VSYSLNHSGIEVTDTYLSSLKDNGGLDVETTPPISETALQQGASDKLQDASDKVIIPSVNEYRAIVTKYKAYHKRAVDTMLNALYFIARYRFNVCHFHNAVIDGGCVSVRHNGYFIMTTMTYKDVDKFKNVIVYYKNTLSLDVSLVDFLKKCYKRGLTKAVYSPNDFIGILS
jgi:hypothetical protein